MEKALDIIVLTALLGCSVVLLDGQCVYNCKVRIYSCILSVYTPKAYVCELKMLPFYCNLVVPYVNILNTLARHTHTKSRFGFKYANA